MNISGIATAASNLAQYKTATDVQLTVFKKAVDISAQNSLQLIEAATQSLPNNPPNLGNSIDTFA
ncbi:MAG: YjfB family protein [Methylotenera sp.]|nr:YjfB family protein [Methylotenera sp.]